MILTDEMKEAIISDYKLIEERILSEVTESHNNSVAKFIIFPFVAENIQTYGFCTAKYSTTLHKVVSITAPIDVKRRKNGKPKISKYGRFITESVTIEL